MSLQEKLHELFLVDQQLRGMQSRVKIAARRLKAEQTKLDQLNQQASELSGQLKVYQAKASTLEHEAKDFEERITRLREQMNQATTNKQYSTLLIEINTSKIDKSKIEDQALEQMSRVESLREQLVQVQAQADGQQKIVQTVQSELTTSEQEISSDLAALEVKRKETAERLSPSSLDLFDRLARVHDGEAMASVEKDDPRSNEYHCGGCYMSLPMERVNSLFRDADPICCPSCGRILYLNEELRSSMSTRK